MDDNFSNRDFWLAGELAKRTGVSTDTLRHYERKGVLPRPRRAHNGYRHYPESALERILLVRRALAVGFTLDELARIFGERDKGGTPCREVYKLAAEKLSGVEEQLNALTDLRDELQIVIADWNKRLSNAKSDTKVRLLESLVSAADDQPKPIRKKKIG
ncbi:Cd(II)/Pb(II)-responsive transcriptional regulator [soil metagenome]